MLVDDDAIQLKLSAVHLKQAGFAVTTANSASVALELAREAPPDAVMSDVIMGEMDGFGLCRRLREQPSLAQVPVVLLSAHYGDSAAHALAESVGASALIARTPEFEAELQTLFDILARESQPVLRVSNNVYEEHLRTNALEISRLAVDAKSAEERYRALFENANDTISVLDGNGYTLEANERWRHVLGIDPHLLVGRHLLDFSPQRREAVGAELEAAIQRGSGRLNGVAIERPDQTTVYVDFSLTVIEVQRQSLVFAIGRDVTGRFLAARALATAEEKYRSLVERMPDVVWTASRGKCVFVTNNIEPLTGYSPAEVYAFDLSFWQEHVHPDDESAFVLAAKGSDPSDLSEGFDLEYRWRHKDGTWVWLWHRVIASYERNGVPYRDGLITDVTSRKQLEESLRQAQKMEAIGQLTGGIAHDFNNILAVILANSQFLSDSINAHDPRLLDVNEIKTAAERAAGLTRQLLAFSRRQVLTLRVIDLNDVVRGVERMLRRLIGEDIELTVLLEPSLGFVRADAGQIEQVLMNLAVNARDAMPKGGKLTIETANIELDAAYRASHATAMPGHYVAFIVSDTGIGMDSDTQRRIFEPFFTTKELGKGTGLGLATSHGIVTQSGGYIEVYSELGRGTAFKVYLPRVHHTTEPAFINSRVDALGGSELLLLVEDDPPLRAAIERMLSSRGYRVLLARDGVEAVKMAQEHGRELALLVTDVVMPNMSGPDAAQAVRAQAPHIKVLFTSGYTDHAVLSSGLLDPAVNFIQKPFSPDAIARRVREVLDSRGEG